MPNIKMQKTGGKGYLPCHGSGPLLILALGRLCH